jgi:hypothetical protein
MKSYLLAPIESRDEAVAALNSVLPSEGETWLLKDADGDIIAYFSLVEADSETGMRTVQADVSGRHYNGDADVIAIVQTLQRRIGGEITHAP